jgi:hypothetical protein
MSILVFLAGLVFVATPVADPDANAETGMQVLKAIRSYKDSERHVTMAEIEVRKGKHVSITARVTDAKYIEHIASAVAGYPQIETISMSIGIGCDPAPTRPSGPFSRRQVRLDWTDGSWQRDITIRPLVR